MELSPEYLRLFNAITDALTQIETLKQQLMQAQRDAEELFIARDEETDEA